MKYRVRLLPPARSDLIRVSDFLADAAPNAALRAADAFDEALRTLEIFPQRVPKTGFGTRELVVPFGQPRYIVRYRVERANVVVLRIFHTREDRR